jgi:hypothetical protein
MTSTNASPTLALATGERIGVDVKAIHNVAAPVPGGAPTYDAVLFLGAIRAVRGLFEEAAPAAGAKVVSTMTIRSSFSALRLGKGERRTSSPVDLVRVFAFSIVRACMPIGVPRPTQR